MRYNTPVDRLQLEPLEDKPTLRLTRKKRGAPRKALSKVEAEKRLMTPRMRDLAEGRLSIEDLDWEELTRGQLRDARGGFSGKPPAILPREWHDKLATEIVKGAEAQFRKNFQETMDVLFALIKNPKTPAREKLAAVIYAQERTIGRVVEKRETKTEVTVFEQLVESGDLLMDLGEMDEDDQ